MKYRVEFTEDQLHLVLRAVNLMMRTGIGQTDDLAEWLATMGDAIDINTSSEVFENYFTTCEVIKPILDGVMKGCQITSDREKSTTVNELETIYQAIRHQEWLDDEYRTDGDVRSREPMKWGNEPIPKIERVEK